MGVVEELNLPEWTEYTTKNGLDPLGMQNTSVNLYQDLMPGIGNVTLRMRYYGLYAWLSWVYAQRVGDTDPKVWRRYIRRTEALYALIAGLRGDESGVTGSNWAKRTLESTKTGPIDFEQAAEVERPNYFAVTWGAYGLAYGSQLFQMNILSEALDHDIPVPSPDAGQRLAEAFDAELGDLATPFYKAIARARVSRQDLERFARLSPSGIRKTGAERTLYEDLLFADKGLGGDGAASRKASLLLLLRLAGQMGEALTPDEARWALYASHDSHGSQFTQIDQALQRQQERWRLYQANDLCHVALETLLKFLLDTLVGHPRGIAAADLIRRCVETILEAGGAAATWQEFVAGVSETANASDLTAEQSERSVSDIMLKEGRSLAVCTPGTALKAIGLLALLHRRYRQQDNAEKSELCRFDPAAFHSLQTESRFLEGLDGLPLRDAISRILDERVLGRHLWVAMKKLRHQGDYTFLLESDDGLLRFREKDGPVFTNPRLGPALRFLRDIHLIDDGGLTARGEKVLLRA